MLFIWFNHECRINFHFVRDKWSAAHTHTSRVPRFFFIWFSSYKHIYAWWIQAEAILGSGNRKSVLYVKKWKQSMESVRRNTFVRVKSRYKQCASLCCESAVLHTQAYCLLRPYSLHHLIHTIFLRLYVFSVRSICTWIVSIPTRTNQIFFPSPMSKSPLDSSTKTKNIFGFQM